LVKFLGSDAKDFQKVLNGRVAPRFVGNDEGFGNKGRLPTETGNYPSEKWIGFLLSILDAVIKRVPQVLMTSAEFLDLLDQVRCEDCLSTARDAVQPDEISERVGAKPSLPFRSLMYPLGCLWLVILEGGIVLGRGVRGLEPVGNRVPGLG
jgi:hypothetical protein